MEATHSLRPDHQAGFSDGMEETPVHEHLVLPDGSRKRAGFRHVREGSPRPIGKRLVRSLRVALALAMGSSAVGIAQAADPPSLPEEPVNYSGLYALTYTSLYGDVDVCVTIGVNRQCVPVALDIPLYNGQATQDSLDFIIDMLNDQLQEMFPRMAADAYPEYETLIDTLFPLLVDELNVLLAALPPTLSLRAPTGSPLFEGELDFQDTPVILPGNIDLASGGFSLIPDFMVGTIDATREFRGSAAYELPLTLSQSTSVEGDDEVVFTLSMNGLIGTDMNMTWGPLEEGSRPTPSFEGNPGGAD